jgi:hypothetical protein
MSREIGLWRVDGAPVRVAPSQLDLEATLEDLIECDPEVLGEPLLLIGRQVPTSYGKFVDLLAVDIEGTLRVLELKRDRTPREVVAQALDYGSWVETLSHSDVLDIFESFRPGKAFEQAFSERFGSSPPEELNEAHTLTIVAADVDASTERIINYLVGYDVPINVVFFRHFDDAGHSYVARSWLVDEERAATAKKESSRTKEPWNNRDWYISFGHESQARAWEDARRYGFVSAGGGLWYTRTIRGLPVGARVSVCIPKTGYVGVGEVTGEAMPADEAKLVVDGMERPFRSLDLHATYHHGSDDPDDLEYIVPVRWHDTRAEADAFWETGMFANQNSACKLRNRFTLERLQTAFDYDSAADVA